MQILNNDNTTNNTSFSTGIIQQIQKAGGWYTVQIENSPIMESIKVRRSQLRAVGVEQNVMKEESRGEASSNDNNTMDPVFLRRLPPPPTINNLDALLQNPIQSTADSMYMKQLRYFSSFSKWLVLTDLHVSPSTLSTCLQVLNETHALAQDRQTGVLFLGDFWHQRQVLRVDCLNAVLNALKTWQVPMIMIPGNHDQITLQGQEHALTPLENAYRIETTANNNNDDGSNNNNATTSSSSSVPGILIFSHPTKFNNALLVPHIRDAAILESILQAPVTLECDGLLLHADVTGAYMNDRIVSQGGVPPYMFPSGKQIYSGHFHKPHVVSTKTVQIEYLGSPYQVSLSEAQQDKALVVLDASQQWKCVERIPMNIGRRHFRITSVDELHQLPPLESNALQAGDRVVCSFGKAEIDHMNDTVKEQIQHLRASGVVVEIRESTDTSSPAVAPGSGETALLEELSPEATWKGYIANEVARDAMDRTTAENLLVAGQNLLDSMADDNEDIEVQSWQHPTELVLDSVSLEGFGPFRTKQTYPLRNRGLVLLRGNNMDGGADSNGSGKSMLAMSTLWCLTGSLDARPLDDSKVSDIVNDESKAARVTVQGLLNGVEFSISRSKTSSKSGLIFLLGGKDMSAQSAKETQALIDETLGVSARVLARTIFHGQHSINDLLEATDAKLKDELSLLVPLTIWQDAATKARKLGRAASKRCDEISGMLSIRKADLEKLEGRYSKTKADLENMELDYSEKVSSLDEEKSLVGSLGEEVNLDQLGRMVEETAALVRALEDECASNRSQRDTELQGLQITAADTRANESTFENDVQSLSRQFDSDTLKVEATQARLRDIKSSWNIDLSVDTETFEMLDANVPESCPTCGQSLIDGHVHKHIQEKVGGDINAALDALTQAQSDCGKTKESLDAATSALKVAKETTERAQEALNNRVSFWNELLHNLEKSVSETRRQYEDASTALTVAARGVHKSSKLDELKVALSRDEDMLQLARKGVDSAERELHEYEDIVKSLVADIAEQKRLESTMSDLSSAFSPRGVQTYVLQNAITSLQNAAQSYLNDFSDGSQRLELSLDAGDRVSRRAFVRDTDGDYKERALASLSGGQWRRCSLSLNLGFADLVYKRGQLRPSLCVLDEPLTHLDRTGRTNVGHVLRNILHRNGLDMHHSFSVSTIILILQDLTAEELEEAFDYIDEVEKKDGLSRVVVDSG